MRYLADFYFDKRYFIAVFESGAIADLHDLREAVRDELGDGAANSLRISNVKSVVKVKPDARLYVEYIPY
jgi:hypothetical protein